MKDTEMAYAAGAFDGDGTVSISRIKRKGGIGYIAQASVTKSCDKLTVFFAEKFGGNLRESGKQRRWDIACTPRVLPFLGKIIPYLQYKKARAEFVYDWLVNGMPDKEEAYQKSKLINKTYSKDFVLKEGREIDKDQIRWAYIAGLMDTDGSFSINKRFVKERPRYEAKINFTEKDPLSVSFIYNTFPFGIAKKVKNKICGYRYEWILCTKEDMKNFIKLILPYMKTKKNNAEILLDFCENSTPVRKGHRFGVPEEELQFREKCYKDLQKHQRRGNWDLYKSSLIDFNTLSEISEGKKAEAAQAGTVNVVSEKTL